MTTLGPQEDLPGHERMAPSTFFKKKTTQPPRDFKPNSCVYFGEREKKNWFHLCLSAIQNPFSYFSSVRSGSA